MDGYWFLGTSFVFFPLISSMLKVSKLIALRLVDIGSGLFIPGLTLSGAFGSDQLPFKIVGYLALLFSISCYYTAAAQITNAFYGR
jgi:hypothetical protein